jgi:hypothetical protein
MEFQKFAQLVNERLNSFAGKELYVTAAPDDVWATYIAAFPEGSNPIYKERTEHDCSCCKNFIRGIGNVVAIIDGKPQSIWNVKAEAPYDTVAKALDNFVTGSQITDLWRTTEHKYGAEHTKQLLEGGTVKRWNHFYGDVPAKQRTATPDKARGDFRTTVHVFKRGLTELTDAALDTVIDLIDSKALYRGEEHLSAIKAFREAKQAYDSMSELESETFVWVNASSPAARFRNTVIGTLIQDLSEGVELEKAVKSFEAKVAPANYKRPTALITEGMIKTAMAKIAELGIEQALERRYAKISDVTINNVLWVHREAAKQMKGGLESLLMTSVKPKVVDEGKAEDISVEDFLANVLPVSTTVEVLLKNSQVGNLVSITAPVHADNNRNLFKWSNDFAWSYNGEVADSIKERVKAAGGNVDAKLRFSLGWSNLDDLDLHVFPPYGGHIYFGNKQGILDVDMNAFGPTSREPVENAAFTNPFDGTYTVTVNQYNQRETKDVGFTLEFADANGVKQYHHPAALKSEHKTSVLVTVTKGVIVKVELPDGLSDKTASKPIWGVNTETFVPVETLMLSPNHWDDNKVGNKHWFFILKGCKSPDTTRGIYNEFLHSQLEEHRKVFEVLGSKVKCPAAEEQLSGVGFSSTRNDTVIVRVTGDMHKTFNVKF